MWATRKRDSNTPRRFARSVTHLRRELAAAQGDPLQGSGRPPGITGTALRIWMETSHPTMPNIIIEKQDMLNVIAYMLSLKGRDVDDKLR
jgi:hypothetical protein